MSGTGVEPASPKGHMILSHARFPISHPDKAYRRRDSNPQKPDFETGTYSNSVTPAKKYPWRGSNPQIPDPQTGAYSDSATEAYNFSAVRRECEYIAQMLPKGVEPSLKRFLAGFLFQLGYGSKKSGQRRTRTFGVSFVTDLQSAAFAARHTCP